MARDSRCQSGQATVELALLMMPILVVVLAVLQVGLLWRDQMLVVHAAREGARAAAVGGDNVAVRAAALEAATLDPTRVSIDVRGTAGAASMVTVTVTYGPPASLPLFGPLVAGKRLSSTATMVLESARYPLEHRDGADLVQVSISSFTPG